MQWRIVAPVVLVTALATALSAFLNYGKFLQTFNDIEESRFAFVADDVRSVIEHGLDLGVPLPALATAQAVIERAAARSPQVADIVLFDLDGRVLFHVVPGPARVPEAWLVALRRPADQWSGEMGGTLVAGTRLVNDIRQTVGGVAVLHSRQRHEDLIGGIARQLTLAGLVSAAVASTLTFLGVTVLVRRLRRQVGRLEAAFDGEVDGCPVPEPRDARRSAEAALVELAAASAELRRLGAGTRP